MSALNLTPAELTALRSTRQAVHVMNLTPPVPPTVEELIELEVDEDQAREYVASYDQAEALADFADRRAFVSAVDKVLAFAEYLEQARPIVDRLGAFETKAIKVPDLTCQCGHGYGFHVMLHDDMRCTVVDCECGS